jgi:hypothetical protein
MHAAKFHAFNKAISRLGKGVAGERAGEARTGVRIVGSFVDTEGSLLFAIA